MAQPTPPPTTATLEAPPRVKEFLTVQQSPEGSPLLQVIQLLGGGAHGLDDDGNGSASLSKSETVRGIRSPSSFTRRIINCPGSAFFAISGASISINVTVAFNFCFFAMRYIISFTSISVYLCYYSNLGRQKAMKIFEKHDCRRYCILLNAAMQRRCRSEFHWFPLNKCSQKFHHGGRVVSWDSGKRAGIRYGVFSDQGSFSRKLPLGHLPNSCRLSRDSELAVQACQLLAELVRQLHFVRR